MAESPVNEQIIAQASRWRALADRFSRGATLRKKAEQEKAVEEKPPAPPDPVDVAIHAWAVRDEETFASLLALIDKSIQLSAAKRREAVLSHPGMAFYEGETSSLEALKLKLTNLKSGQA